MTGPKQKLSFFYTVEPVVDSGFSCSGSKDRLTPSPPPSADLLLPKMEEVVALNDRSHPCNCHDLEPFREFDITGRETSCGQCFSRHSAVRSL